MIPKKEQTCDLKVENEFWVHIQTMTLREERLFHKKIALNLAVAIQSNST